MRHLRRFLCPEFIFGDDSRLLAGRYAAGLGACRPLLVSDPGVITAGWVNDVVASLEAHKMTPAVFSGVTPNPTADQVMAGAAVHESCECDIIVAVGGGSVMDCAKGIGIVRANGGHILDYTGIDHIPHPGPPLICVPTTAGSSADLSQFAVITDTERRVKMTIMSKAAVPDLSLIDPTTLSTCGRALTAACGLDALAHAAEALVSRAGSPIVDMHAIEAIRLIRRSLPRFFEVPEDADARTAVMRASLHAGLAFSNGSLGAAHAMAHPLGGTLGLAHGEAAALVLEHVIAFNFQQVPERYGQMGRALGLHLDGLGERQTLSALRADIAHLKAELGFQHTLGARGVSRSDILGLADQAHADLCLVTNPRAADRRDLEVIYEEAL